jgi:hypothetical protein
MSSLKKTDLTTVYVLRNQKKLGMSQEFSSPKKTQLSLKTNRAIGLSFINQENLAAI